MPFSATIPASQIDSANAALEAQGFGSGNFSRPMREGSGEATHVGLHTFDVPGLRAAVAAIPNVQITDGASATDVTFAAHAAAQTLDWSDPANWFAQPRMIGHEEVVNGVTYRSKIDNNPYPVTITFAWEVVGSIPAWRPFDGTNTYFVNDRVTHNGKVWRNTWDGNFLEPGTPGSETFWIEVEA